MRRIYLQKIEQYNYVSYVGKIDPRDLVRVAVKIEMGEAQSAQRPLSKKRVKDIASYVRDGGKILPNTLTIATIDNKYTIHECLSIDNLYYIDFPSEADEYNDFSDSIFVMDGQHRLYSFLDEIRLISDDVKYEIGFCLYINPTMDTKRRIFVSCNEKQEKVSSNLLMWFKDKLNLISGEEKTYYDLVSKLNCEYPLRNRIILGGESVKNGIKAKELLRVLKENQILSLSTSAGKLSDEEIIDLICKYLCAWENVIGFSFSNPNKSDGASVKISGLRFMISILPTFWDIAIERRIKFDNSFLEDTIKKMIAQFGVERDDFFTCDDHKMYFRERSSTEQFGTICSNIIKKSGNENFNPLGN